MNRKVIILFSPLVIAAIIIIALSISQGNVPIEQPRTVVLRVGGDNNFPPYEYVDENDMYTGFNVDIMRAIALSTGIDIKFYPMSWAEACEELKNDNLDVIQGMKYTKERDKDYDFSDEYLENNQSIFVLSSTEGIDEFEDLKGKRVVIQQGDVALSNLKTLDGVNITLTTDQEKAITSLLKGEVDAYIGNTLTGVFLINKVGEKNQIKIVGKTLNPTEYSIAVRDGNSEILNIINNGLKNIKNNGTYDKIYRKWFGQPVNFPSWYIDRVIYISAVVIIIFFILILLFYRWNTLLKAEVNKQTMELNNANETLVEKNTQIKREMDFREHILNNIFSGVVTINRDGIITFSNKMANKILNLSSKHIIGRHYEDTGISDMVTLETAMETDDEKEISIGGKKKYVNYRVDLLKSTDKKINEIIVLFRDVTEEKLMQENIRTKDKLQSLGNLIAGIAHELRNPLTSIKTYTELIPKKFDNPKFREMIAKDIPSEIDRLNSLINDLIEYSRPRKPLKEDIKLFDAVSSVVLLLRNKINNENIQVKNNIERHLIVNIDRNHFRQVLINIILNAVESMDKEKKVLIISTESYNNTILLSIKDNGCGMDEERLSRIFDPFYTTKPSGTGLGLFVSYQLLAENGAQTKIESTEGQGTTFTIKFEKPESDTYGQTAHC